MVTILKQEEITQALMELEKVSNISGADRFEVMESIAEAMIDTAQGIKNIIEATEAKDIIGARVEIIDAFSAAYTRYYFILIAYGLFSDEEFSGAILKDIAEIKDSYIDGKPEEVEEEIDFENMQF